MGNTSYGNVNNTSYASAFGAIEETRGQRVQRLLDRTKKQIEFNYMTAISFGKKAQTTQGGARPGLGTTGMHSSFLDRTTYPGGAEEDDSMIH